MPKFDSDDIFSHVRKILARMVKLKESSVTIESHLRDDLGVDSVDIWDIVAKMEEEFSIDVEEEDIRRGLSTVQDVVNLVKDKLRTAKS